MATPYVDAMVPQPPMGFRPVSPDGRFYWDGYQWVSRPPLTPDGRFYWDGHRWMPVAFQSAIRPSRKPLLGWLGVGAAWVALILTISLLSMPMLLVGGLEVALPLVMALAGLVLGSRGNLAQRLLAWIPATLAVLVTVLAVVALAFS